MTTKRGREEGGAKTAKRRVLENRTRLSPSADYDDDDDDDDDDRCAMMGIEYCARERRR